MHVSQTFVVLNIIGEDISLTLFESLDD